MMMCLMRSFGQAKQASTRSASIFRQVDWLVVYTKPRVRGATPGGCIGSAGGSHGMLMVLVTRSLIAQAHNPANSDCLGEPWAARCQSIASGWSSAATLVMSQEDRVRLRADPRPSRCVQAKQSSGRGGATASKSDAWLAPVPDLLT